MRWLAVLAAIALAAPADAAHARLCAALTGLKAEARSSGAPQHVSVLKNEPMTFACVRRSEVAAQVAFCAAAGETVGLEFTHGFPWQVYDCLRSEGLRPSLTLVNQYTGMRHRRKITHLWAGWKDGTRIDIRFEPNGDFSDDAEFRDYWGAYRLVVWAP